MSERDLLAPAPNLIASSPDGGRIAENLVRFSRLLRDAGLPIGPDRTILATRSVLTSGLQDIHVFYAALETALISRHEHHDIFDQAFRIFWKEPATLDPTSDALPAIEDQTSKDKRQLSRRLLDPLIANHPILPPRDDELEIDARETFSSEEVLRNKDFEQMTAEELLSAVQMIPRMKIVNEKIATRRYRPAGQGERIDIRAIHRDMATKGPDYLRIWHKRRKRRLVPLILLIDISGSMDTYARIMLHFIYALINQRPKVHAFLFGTRLTNITRHLAGSDPDAAIRKVVDDVEDWAGGTRIGESLSKFNQHWAKRVLGQNATVLLVTDGLDRQGGQGIATSARRLRASCRRLVWLNPLLRYDGYEALASGARELIKHASELRMCHNLNSLEELAEALNNGQTLTTRPMP